VAFAILDMCDEADAAGVMLVRRIIEALTRGPAKKIHP